MICKNKSRNVSIDRNGMLQVIQTSSQVCHGFDIKNGLVVLL